MSELEEDKLDIEIEDRIKVVDGEHKGEEGRIVNVYKNTSAIEFDNILTKDKSKYRTVIKHNNYKKID
ncbi:KOW motif-containing protein [Bacillus suaedae]|uniref:KOW motif-containing protein n=1 Tax=Halalkalibacter suaedae TaxID=2822140 RepID=A0A940WUX9_9BACI|nr:KOW motif-containing protein [Bacillus suaedae]MBP3953224.1 KOW motif-containing protein [Bacillus suaedae]